MIKLVIFDMDGVITETSEQHYQAWKNLAKSIGIAFDRTFNEELKGVSRRASLEKILRHGGVYEKHLDQIDDLMFKKNENYKALIQEISPDNLFAGMIDILKILKAKKIKVAVGSASKNAPFLVEKLGISGFIDYIVDPAKVPGKPAPDIFLDAASYFDIPVSQCLGVEDAYVGVKAIKSAGMFAIGIGDKDVLSQADIVYATTEESLEYFKHL